MLAVIENEVVNLPNSNLPKTDVNLILNRPVKCANCKIKHKMRNVINGVKLCPICWDTMYGVKRK